MSGSRFTVGSDKQVKRALRWVVSNARIVGFPGIELRVPLSDVEMAMRHQLTSKARNKRNYELCGDKLTSYLSTAAGSAFLTSLDCDKRRECNQNWLFIKSEQNFRPERLRDHLDTSWLESSDEESTGDEVPIDISHGADSLDMKIDEEVPSQSTFQPMVEFALVILLLILNLELTELWRVFKLQPNLGCSDEEIEAHVREAFSAHMASGSLHPISAKSIHCSPIDSSKNETIKKVCPNLFRIIWALVSSSHDKDNDSAMKTQELEGYVQSVIGLIINCRFKGQIQSPILQTMALLTSSLTIAQNTQLSRMRWSLCNKTNEKIVKECVSAWEKAARFAISIAISLGYVLIIGVDNYVRMTFRTILNTGKEFTKQFPTQTLLYTLLPSASVDPRFILPNLYKSWQEFHPVRTWRTLDQFHKFICSNHDFSPYLSFLDRSDLPHKDQECIRGRANARLRNIIPDVSLSGRSSLFQTFVNDTLRKITSLIKGRQFLVVDPEYLFHYFKVIEGAKIMPWNETVCGYADAEDKLYPIPPGLHMYMHAAKNAVNRKCNFINIFYHLFSTVFPNFKKAAVKNSNSAEAEPRKKAKRDQKNDVEDDKDDEEWKIGSSLSSSSTSKSSKKRKSKAAKIDETCNFRMSFQRLFIVLEILLDEFMKLSKSAEPIQFTSRNAQFLTQFFTIELPFIVLGLQDYRKGKASTFLSSLPFMVYYFVLTSHYKLTYCCLSMLNNLDYWKAHHDEVIKSILMNCDYGHDELIELVHGCTASVGHLNRKNQDDATHDVPRLYATQAEQRQVHEDMPEEGEVLKRSKMIEKSSLNDTKAAVRQFIIDLAAGKFESGDVTAEPLLAKLRKCENVVKQQIVDYTRHHTKEQYSTEIKSIPLPANAKSLAKIIHYKPFYDILREKMDIDETEFGASKLTSCLDSEDDIYLYAHLMNYSKYFEGDSTSIPCEFSINSTF